MPARLATLLALNGDRSRSVNELVEMMWGDNVPPSARASLHMHLGSVRRWLATGPLGGAAVERSAAGYRLALGTMELDSALMVELVTDAHPRLSEAPRESLGMLRAACSLWRNPQTEHWMHVPPALERLEATRLIAEELLAEALLATGDWTEAEAHCAGLVHDQPFRELRWAQLIRARYLAGRPHEALQTYQAARSLLAEELGTEPGPVLRELERAVLIHDVERIAAGPGLRRAARDLPSPGGSIVGRSSELQRCAEALAVRHAVAIHGAPGVGKTRLAQELCRTADVTDLVLWVDLEARGGVLEAIAVALGSSASSSHSEICALLARQRSLVVLDNAEHLSREVGQVGSRLLQALPDLQLVVTSRVRVSLPAVYVELKVLSIPADGESEERIEESPAVQVLRSALADLAPNAQLTTAEIVSVCEQTGGLPLALRLAAGAMRAVDPSLRRHTMSLDVSPHFTQMVQTTTALLSVATPLIYVRLSTIVGEFDAELGAAVAEVTLDEFVPAVVELVDHGLVDVVTGSTVRYRILPPLRDAALLLADDPVIISDASDRLAGYCIEKAKVVAQEIRGGAPMDEAENQLSSLIPRVRAAMDHLARICDAERALELACRLEVCFYTLGWWTEKNELLDAALGVPGPSSARRARALALRSRPGTLSGSDPQMLAKAEHMAEDIGADMLVAFCAHLRGVASWWRGDYDDSIDASRRSAEQFELAGRSIEALEALKFVGLAMFKRGEIDEGLRVQHDVLNRFERLGIAFHVAHSLGYLGHCHAALGDDESAQVDLQGSLTICQRLGNRGTAIHVHLGLGELAIARGEIDAAMRHASAALELSARARLRAYEPWAWAIALRASVAGDDFDRAVGCGRRGLDALRFAPEGDAARLSFDLAELALRLGDARRAARLIGAGSVLTEPREIPFVYESELTRRGDIEQRVRAELNDEADRHVGDGRRCTVAGAAHDLLERVPDHLM